MSQKDQHFLGKKVYQTRKKEPLKLYHFTTLTHLEGILKEGITRGVVPRSMTNYIESCQWLTSNLDWYPAWAAGLSNKYTRTQARITVEIRNSRKLVPWLEFGEKNVPADMFKTLNQFDNPDDWYIYRGVIPINWFLTIDYRNQTNSQIQ